MVDEQLAGNVLSWMQDDQCLVGYWIGQNWWGQGVATQALREYLQVVTERPLYAYVARRNVPSIRVLEKCGFEQQDLIVTGDVEEFFYCLRALP